ncbi:hypothetical protein OPV22_009182 [Ensete ventricosum]|uniref:Uncharacterized protein n=1 Tax=Ensete ventricosum TaxID=4639 RepID=A0AAV8RAF1_ENSVE|nr:hypothetical protein OPV22_009182 [Ensete ventricosum]
MRLSSSLSSSIRFLFLMAAVAALLFTQFQSAYGGGAKAWRKERMLGGRVGWNPPSPATNTEIHHLPLERPSSPGRN